MIEQSTGKKYRTIVSEYSRIIRRIDELAEKQFVDTGQISTESILEEVLDEVRIEKYQSA